jgi:argininosuccinate lyase
MAARAGMSWVTATELADTLAREHGLPFVSAHAIAAAVVRRCGDDRAGVAGVFADVAAEHGAAVRLTAADLERILSPSHFVTVRETPGGPGPRAITAALDASAEALARDRGRLGAIVESWRNADAARRAAVEALRAGEV